MSIKMDFNSKFPFYDFSGAVHQCHSKNETSSMFHKKISSLSSVYSHHFFVSVKPKVNSLYAHHVQPQPLVSSPHRSNEFSHKVNSHIRRLSSKNTNHHDYSEVNCLQLICALVLYDVIIGVSYSCSFNYRCHHWHLVNVIFLYISVQNLSNMKYMLYLCYRVVYMIFYIFFFL